MGGDPDRPLVRDHEPAIRATPSGAYSASLRDALDSGTFELHHGAHDAKMKSVNEELRALLSTDQDDRGGGKLSPDALERDRVRLRRVKELLEAGAAEDAEDLFCAAMILQHGSALEDYWQAHELAKASADGGYAPARWLAAAAYDRWLMHQGEPQHFGTQYFAMAGGPLRLWEVDVTTSDDERARWDVPPLRDALERVEGRVQPASIQFEAREPAALGGQRTTVELGAERQPERRAEQ